MSPGWLAARAIFGAGAAGAGAAGAGAAGAGAGAVATGAGTAATTTGAAVVSIASSRASSSAARGRDTGSARHCASSWRSAVGTVDGSASSIATGEAGVRPRSISTAVTLKPKRSPSLPFASSPRPSPKSHSFTRSSRPTSTLRGLTSPMEHAGHVCIGERASELHEDRDRARRRHRTRNAHHAIERLAGE